jgi:hypothetical protein
VAASILESHEGWGIARQVFTACTGSVLGQFYNGANSQWSEAQTQTKEAHPRFNVITLSFGGNDIGFKSVLVDCYEQQLGWVGSEAQKWTAPPPEGLTGRCPDSQSSLAGRVDQLVQGDTTDSRHLEFGPQNSHLTLAGFYAEVANNDLAPGGELVVVGYPAPFAPTSEWGDWRNGQCDFLDAQDATMLDSVAQYLDQSIAAAVQSAQAQTSNHIHYVSLYNGYTQDGINHSLCSG